MPCCISCGAAATRTAHTSSASAGALLCASAACANTMRTAIQLGFDVERECLTPVAPVAMRRALGAACSARLGIELARAYASLQRVGAPPAKRAAAEDDPAAKRAAATTADDEGRREMENVDDPFSWLPDEVLLRIVAAASAAERNRLSLVSRRFRRMAADPAMVAQQLDALAVPLPLSFHPAIRRRSESGPFFAEFKAAVARFDIDDWKIVIDHLSPATFVKLWCRMWPRDGVLLHVLAYAMDWIETDMRNTAQYNLKLGYLRGVNAVYRAFDHAKRHYDIRRTYQTLTSAFEANPKLLDEFRLILHKDSADLAPVQMPDADAAALQSYMAAHPMVSRLGGDEALVLLQETIFRMIPDAALSDTLMRNEGMRRQQFDAMSWIRDVRTTRVVRTDVLAAIMKHSPAIGAIDVANVWYWRKQYQKFESMPINPADVAWDDVLALAKRQPARFHPWMGELRDIWTSPRYVPTDGQDRRFSSWYLMISGTDVAVALNNMWRDDYAKLAGIVYADQ